MNLLKPITSDHDLIELANKLNIHIDQILTIDEVKHHLTKGTYLILLRRDTGVGHWVCANDGEYFDPTGVGPPTKIGNLPYNQIQYQGTYTEYCGIYCLLWLYAKQKNRPELMRGFANLDIDFV